MKHIRQKAIFVATVLCLGLFSGCGTSQLSQEESTSDQVDSNWADLTIPSPSQTMPSLPETTEETTETGEQDVTATYINIFLGLWDNADMTKTYEFLSNENLIVTQGATTTNYTYWILDRDGQPELNIFENGAQEAERYSFSQCGSNLTLYDVVTGNAAELLTKRVEEAEETEETATPTAAATTEPTVTPTATPAATATAVPSTEPTVVPTVEPTAAPVEEVTVVVPEEIQLPQSIYSSLSAVECVLDVVLDGTAFDGTNSDSFWNTLARYLSRSMDSDTDGTFTVSTAQVSATAREVFSGLASVPDCPQSGNIATLETAEDGTETYRLLWGATGGHDLEVTAYDGVDTIEVTADGGSIYAVRLDSSGAVISVTAA